MAAITTGTLSANLAAGADERIDELVRAPGARIERIVSHGHFTSPGEWYEQDRNEFVLLVAGAARLRFEGESNDRMLDAGDYLDIPAHCRHRVEWTDPTRDTVWLAVHYE
ncbi:MAG: cupin domain-containing protein [Alphaproteobacteria bacterium]|nr:cupin domain-containing protein [Alphaproteobacteria bacterium]